VRASPEYGHEFLGGLIFARCADRLTHPAGWKARGFQAAVSATAAAFSLTRLRGFHLLEAAGRMPADRTGWKAG